MKQYQIIEGAVYASRLAFGCMTLDRVPTAREREELVAAALDLGINLFDHADIYAAGHCERLFGELLRKNPGWRDRMLIQSKCGIRFPGDTYDDGPPARYDFSADHILQSVEGSLERLGIERLDVLLLHRPDLLMEVDEVARAFDELSGSGKVRFFGVSNFNWAQLDLLGQSVGHRLVVNQVQLSVLHSSLIAEGVLFNTDTPYTANAGTLDFCRRHDIHLQAWSPLARGEITNTSDDAPAHVRATAMRLAELANNYGSNPAAIALAWLLRHPAGIQPVVGTSSIERLRLACEADTIELSREEWYGLLEMARGAAVP